MSIEDYMSTTGNGADDAGGAYSLRETDTADVIPQEGADAVEAFLESDMEAEVGAVTEDGKTRLPSDLCWFVNSYTTELQNTLYDVKASDIRDERDREALMEAYSELTETVIQKMRSAAEILGREDFLEEMRRRIEEILKH